jgi:sec-independent protein translocase protein TatB
VVGLVVFGPERLPKAAADAGRFIRQLRQMARGATEQLKSELGPEFADLDLASMHPRRLINDHILGEDSHDATSSTNQ